MIGQTEVCHLWNLVVEETHGGYVYGDLLDKLEQARQALGGQVFEVLGKLLFEGESLRELLIEAIRYGEQPARCRAYLYTVLENALEHAQIQNLLEARALAHDAMDASRVYALGKRWSAMEARLCRFPTRLSSFSMKPSSVWVAHPDEREPRRYEITHVPAPIRNRDRLIGTGEPVLPRYEGVAF